MTNEISLTHKHNTAAIDLVKLIMAIIVVAIHTKPLIGISNTVVTDLFDVLSQLPVPFFFLASGYLLGIKFLDCDDRAALLWGYLKKTVKLYLIWTAVYFPLAIVGFADTGLSSVGECVRYIYIRGILLIGENYNSWHLWYLLSVIYTVLILLFLAKRKVGIKGMVIFGCCAFCAGLAIDWLTSASGALPSVLTFARKAFAATVVNGRLLRGMFYIPMGILLAKKKIPAPYSVLLAAISFAACYFLNGVFYGLSIAICSVCLFCAVISIDMKKSPALLVMRKISTDMYFLHMWIWTAYYALIYGEKHFGLDSFLVTTVVCIGISLLLQLLKRKLPAKSSGA